MNSILRNLRACLKVAFVGLLLIACAGCHTLAPTPQQQLQANDANHSVNPELAGPLECIGTFLYYAATAYFPSQ